jgi:transposase
MNGSKTAPAPGNGKSLILEEYDHYVAVDWSQQTMALAHMGKRIQEPVVAERASNLKDLKEYLGSLRGRIVLVIEETTTAQWLYLELRESVHRLVICNPYRNRLLSEGPKTDKIDASKLCKLLRSGLLKEVYHSSDELFELRTLVSSYQDVVKAGVRAKNQRASLTRGHSDHGTHGTFAAEQLDRAIVLYETTKDEYEKKFSEFCRGIKSLKLLLPVPGIGTINAVKIVATVVDARRFPRRGQYLAYCGLVRNERLSGGRSYGRRKPRYCRTLKSVYKTAALIAIRGRNPVRDYYERLLAEGVAEHNARHAVARYLAVITYGILKTGTPYEPYRWRKTSASTEDEVA